MIIGSKGDEHNPNFVTLFGYMTEIKGSIKFVRAYDVLVTQEELCSTASASCVQLETLRWKGGDNCGFVAPLPWIKKGETESGRRSQVENSMDLDEWREGKRGGGWGKPRSSGENEWWIKRAGREIPCVVSANLPQFNLSVAYSAKGSSFPSTLSLLHSRNATAFKNTDLKASSQV